MTRNYYSANSNDNDNNRYMKSAIGTAIYILKCIEEGQSKKEIIDSLDNNEQLVYVWIEYLIGIRWLEEDAKGNLLASVDGKLWIKRYNEILLPKQQEDNIQATLENTDNNDNVKSQEKVIDSFQSRWAEFIETILPYRAQLWNFYCWLPVIKEIAETYQMMASRLVDNSIAAGRAANQTLSANMEVLSSSMQHAEHNFGRPSRNQ